MLHVLLCNTGKQVRGGRDCEPQPSETSSCDSVSSWGGYIGGTWVGQSHASLQPPLQMPAAASTCAAEPHINCCCLLQVQGGVPDQRVHLHRHGVCHWGLALSLRSEAGQIEGGCCPLVLPAMCVCNKQGGRLLVVTHCHLAASPVMLCCTDKNACCW